MALAQGDTTKCLHEQLFSEAHVPYAEMQKLRLCVSSAKENPHHLDLGVPEVDPGGNVAPELAAAVAAQLPVTHGLTTFQLKPPRPCRRCPVCPHGGLSRAQVLLGRAFRAPGD